MIDPVKISRVGAPVTVPVRSSLAGNSASASAVDTPPRSDTGALAIDVRTLASGAPPIDDARVDSIRAAIAEGRYPVDPVRIAAAMLTQDRGA